MFNPDLLWYLILPIILPIILSAFTVSVIHRLVRGENWLESAGMAAGGLVISALI